MRRRRTADEVARLLRKANPDPANGLTVSVICRKVGIPRRPIIGGDSDTTQTRSTPRADAASWRPRLNASSRWWPSYSWTS